MVQLSYAEVRQIVLNAQILVGDHQLAKGKAGVLQVIDQLGYVQIDTINVIERAHHHTLFTRIKDYQPAILMELLVKDRAIFEYWGHAMSYLLMSDYRFYLPRMKKFYNPHGKWMRQQLEQAGHLLDAVRDRIKAEGPLSAKDFSSDKQKEGTLWDWKPAKVALEILFWRGELMISKRKKFQKYYDMTERILPDHINLTNPGEKEIAKFLVRRALKAMGIANEKEIQKFLQPEAGRDSELRVVEKKKITEAILDLLEEREIIAVQIEDSEEYNYIYESALENIGETPDEYLSLYILSPFDNLIIQRDRLKRLFDFDYTLECYLPEAKRKYGYFVLPLLYGNGFVGRMDVKADRKSKTFIVKNLMYEDGLIQNKKFFFNFVRALLNLT